MSLITASPCVESYREEPMTIAEIDAHPDAARIWATIESIKAEATDDAEAEADDANKRMDRIIRAVDMAIDLIDEAQDCTAEGEDEKAEELIGRAKDWLEDIE